MSEPGGRLRTVRTGSNTTRSVEEQAMSANQPTAQGSFWRDDEPKKRCRKCNAVKFFKDFQWVNPRVERRRNGATWFVKGRYRSYCLSCQVVYRKERLKTSSQARELQKQTSQRSALKRRFGITQKQYQDMLAVQGGVCAICNKPETGMDSKRKTVIALSVDHDHTTGSIRALLCGDCNRGLGLFGEDPDLLERAAEYLRKHKAGT